MGLSDPRLGKVFCLIYVNISSEENEYVYPERICETFAPLQVYNPTNKEGSVSSSSLMQREKSAIAPDSLLQFLF